MPPAVDAWLNYSERRRVLDEDLKSTLPYLRGRIIEIGSGRRGRRGRFTPPFEAAAAWIYVDRDGQRQPSVQADIQALPFTDVSADTVLCLEVLEYVETPAVAIAEMWRVVRPGGTVIVSMPFLHRADHPDDRWRLTEAGLVHLMRDAGLEIIDIRRQGAALAVIVNIAKFVIGTQPGLRRRVLGVIARPVATWLLRLDTRLAAHHGELRTFSTGWLIVAAKPADYGRSA